MRLFIIITAVLCSWQAQAVNPAQWIWQQADGPQNTWMAFRKTINIDDVPAEVMTKISVDTKYWLWINGEMVLFEGGLARGAAPNTIYYDPVDFAPYLKQGENTIAILVWYWGRTHKTHESSGKGGLCLSSDDVPELNTNNTWKMKVHPAYDPNSGGNGSPNRAQPFHVRFDGLSAMGDWTDEAWYTSAYDDSSWGTPTQKGGENSQPWGTWVERAIPQWNDRGLVDYTSLKVNSTEIQLPYTNTTGADVKISAKLPFNQQVTPFVKVNSSAGKTIFMDTDNPTNILTGTYITKAGNQQFESYTWFNGHNVEYTIPAGVEVLELKYRWTGVGEMTGDFECSDADLTRLWWMARNTLYICARDCYMDCPDRERGLWIGDVADQAGAIFYTLDEPGRLLLKKAIDNTIEYRDGDIIQGLAPGFGAYRGESSELVSQSLQFIIQGIWKYYYNTGDTATMANAYPAILNYLKVWNMQSNGMPEYRKGYANWVDWGDNPDTHPTTFIWYYMALKTAKDIAVITEQHQDTTWYNTRIKSIEDNFESIYWRGTHYGTVGRAVEERVTSLAVISGLAKEEHYDVIVENNLIPIRKASPHMEWMVEEALVLAGYPEKALQRMKERYQPQVNRTNLTTLYEKFPSGGTPNHAWNAPNYVLSRYVAGIRATEVAWKTFEVLPILTDLTSVKSVVPSVKGDIKVEVQKEKSSFKLSLESPDSTTAIVGIPKTNTEIIEVKVAGQSIWKDSAFVSGVQGVSFHGEDDKFLKFNVQPGTWAFDATIFSDYVPEISFTTPTDDAVIEKGEDELVIELNATDDIGIEKVELYLDAQLIDTKTEGPFTWSESNTTSIQNLTSGKHTLKGIITDTSGKIAQASIEIIILDMADVFANKLLFYLPLEGNGKDHSGNNNHATMGSAVTYDSGKYGNAASFSYTEGSYFTSADSVFEYSNPATAYTIAFWLKVTDYSQRGDILQPTNGRTLLYSNGDLNFRCSHQKKTISFSVDEGEKNDWHHVALLLDQRKGQRKHQVLINGQQRGGIAEGYDFETGKPQAIGKLIFGSFSATSLLRNFTGMLDEVCMFNDVLSEAEIQVLMNAENIKSYLSQPSSIQNVSASNELQLYPNPTAQELSIVGANVISAEVYNLSGKMVGSFSVNNNKLDVSILASGLYILKMKDVNKTFYRSRFVKQ